MAFDARPLLLPTPRDIEDYIRYRWLLAGRNALCKVIRLNKVLSEQELYDSDYKNDLDFLSHLVESNSLQRDFEEAISDFTLFVPTSLTHDARFEEYHSPDGTSGVEELCQRLKLLSLEGS